VRGPEAVAQQDPSRVVANINGKTLTAKEAAGLLKAIPPDQLKKYENNLPAVLQQLVMSQQLAEEAVKEGLDQQSPWKEQIQLNRNSVLTQAYLAKKANTSSSTPGADPQQYYSSHEAEFDRAKLKGIFVAFSPPGTPASATNSRTEDQARAKADEIEKKLKAGGDFSTLARTDSDNQQAAAKGGDIGTFSLGDPQLPADVKTAVDKLQPGQTAEPVRMPNAFLILKLESRSKLTFDQAKNEIVQKLQAERNQAAVKQEVDKYKIDVKDPDFFNASATTPGGAHIPSLQRPAPTPSSSAPQAKP
jgi:parvulin-like peptidyl-prolyl isomerase